MTVLFKKCTYGLLLIATTITCFCNADIQCIDTETESLIDCPIACTSGDMQSILYINEILHNSANEIDITIPEELEREYTGDTETLNIEIIGYGYDQEKMQSIVNTQFTPPTSEDLSNAIGKIADFLPLLAIMLLIVYAWWLIKKIF